MMPVRYTIVDTAHILVVDDEEAILEVVSTMLESRGYKCTALSNGRAAQEFIRKQAPDLILLDLILPEIDGIQLLDWLRGFNREIPVIILTGIHDISTALQVMRRGAYDYILKPFEKDQLFHAVGRAWQHRVRRRKQELPAEPPTRSGEENRRIDQCPGSSDAVVRRHYRNAWQRA